MTGVGEDGGQPRDDVEQVDRLLAQFAEQEREIRAGEARAAALEQDVAALRARLSRIDESVTWRLFERAQGRLYRSIGGRGSRSGQLLQRTLRTTGRRLNAGSANGAAPDGVPGLAPIRFPAVHRPVASIVIPVHAQPELTEACLRSIAAQTDGPSYEVIVVDDCAPGHEAVWAALEGAHVIHNSENLGYLRNNNLAAQHARGRHLVLLNNDTEVRSGWLQALVTRAESAPDVGAVAAMLLNLDGSLQEAGSIVFSDATGWNYGRGLDPERPEFNYVREVDYGSAACLLVRTDVWREIGGFDERYLPMYYEDADLCFAVRDLGLKVLFEPTARVMHVEGATAGTDLASGSKRHQELNRPKFAEKWRARLEADQLPSSPGVVRRASDRNRGPHVLVIDHRLPAPDRDAGSLRMEEMLKALLELGCRVTFLPDDHRRWEPYTRRLQALGVEVLYAPMTVPAEIAAIGEHMKLAIVSRPYVATRYLHMLREHAPAARIVYDTVDLHYLREARRSEYEGPGVGGAPKVWKEIELALVRVTDVTSVVSEAEREELAREVPGARVALLPLANAQLEEVPPADGRAGLLFVGGFQHQPNTDAVKWLVEAIMPLVRRELGEIPVTIVGPDPPPDVLALHGDGVEVAGWVKDLQPLLDGARVMVAPLRYGAGVKGKVTQSLAVGLPVVTTSIGAEGLDAEDGREMLIADDPAGLAERIVRAYRDDALWGSLSAAGRDLVERTASPDALRQGVAALLRDAS